ncbi:MAG: electron transport complex subunit RsxC [Planctomycetota bacterium]|jgi:electron transport complex protein RnfC
MTRLFFKGGVHPPERKVTAPLPLETAPPPALAVVPLQQHLGKPAKPIVKKKEKVLRGQIIGEADGFISANIHAPISGTVKSVEPRRHPVGAYVEAVVIESDGEDQAAEFQALDPEQATPEIIRERVRDAGVVGMGGAAFPTAVKISPPEGKSIDTLIINGCECEPYLTADHRLMLEAGEKIVRGASLLHRVLGSKRWIMAIEDNKPDAVTAMEKTVSSFGGEVAVPHVKYPQGAEKQLIKACLGREVPSAGLPLDVGVVVQNVGTAAAVFDAVASGVPLLERVVTVAGDGIREKKNLMARVGTLFKDLVEFCGGAREETFKVVMGGPMMGISQFTLEVPVVKGTSGLLFLTREEAGDPVLQPCLRCGKCIEACPMVLVPSEVSKAVEKGLYDLAESLNILDCIECGCCAYTCPANRYIVQNIKRGKIEVLANRKK